MSAALSISVDLADFDALIDGRADQLAAATRPAAQAGADVLYKAVKANVAALGRKTGNLDRAIYQAFSADNSTPGRNTYHVSWNARKAPHGHLVEHGFMQRYVMYKDSQGRVRPLVRPGMEDKPRPGRHATQDVKDAYFVPLPGGPRQVPGKAFLRKAWAERRDAAYEAAAKTLMDAATA